MLAPIKLLLIEDNLGDVRLVKEMLSEVKISKFNLISVKTLLEAKTFLNKETVDTILLDLGLPDSRGFDTFKAVNNIKPYIPIIILTGLQDEELAIKAVKAGAQDYLVKGEINGALLSRAISYGIERKRAEKNLKEFADILEHADEAIYTRQFDGVILSWNKGAEKILGYAASEIIGKNNEILCPTNLLKDELEKIDNQLRQGVKIIDYETIRKRKDGTDVNVSLTMSPLRDAAKNIIGVIVIGRDITQQKRSEQILAIEYRVSLSLVESATLEHAAFSVLKTMAEILEWQVGELWAVDLKNNRLQCVSTWHASEKYRAFVDVSRQSIQSLDEGIPGYIWQTHNAYWAPELKSDTHINREQLVKDTGFESCIGFPIVFGEEVLGIIIFFSAKTSPKDVNLLSRFYAIGEQLGGFIKRKRLEGDLNYLSQHDVLTGLLNKTLLEKSFSELLTKAKIKKEFVAFLFIDLDNFKKINETAGHVAGDMVLVDVVSRLRATVRQDDLMGRISGDKFILILPGLKKIIDINSFYQKILEVIAKPYKIENQTFFLTASIGISIFPDDGDDFQTLLKNADIALYFAKKNGGNNAQFCNADFETHVKRKVNLEKEMVDAFKKNEFLMYYQPIIDAKTKKIISLEALVRWQHPTKGLVLPNDFIPLAEETHLIIPLGDWILKTALNQMKQFQSIDKNIVLTINLSPMQLLDPYFLKKLNAVIQDLNVTRENIEFEITESVLMEVVVKNIDVLNAIKETGAKISIDDFGTGYASFSYLQHFIVDVIKIDQSFCAALAKPKTKLIVKAIIAVAHALSAVVVAEGVETKEQADFLVENGCDRLQGYYFYKPKPAKEIGELLK